MAPITILKNSLNSTWRNTVMFCQPGLGNSSQTSHFYDLEFGQFGSGIRNSFIRGFISRSSSSFVSHILHILFLSTYKQMFRVNTSPNITRMADIHIFRNRSYMKFIGKSVSSYSFSSKNSVAGSVQFPSPQPTIGGFINRLPKACNTYTHAISLYPYKGVVK